MIEKATFKYSAKDGIVELEGSENFVSKHFDSLTDIIRILSTQTPVEKKTKQSDIIKKQFITETSQARGGDDAAHLENVKTSP